MQILKKFLDFYINTSIHIGFAVFCLVKVTVISNQLNETNNFSICVFLGTILSYNFLKYFEIFRSDNINFKKYLSLILVSFIALIGFFITFYSQNFSIQKHLFISGLLVFAYPFLRKHGWLKLFLVSFAITYITVFIPYQTEKWILLDYDINLVQRFLLVTSLLIPFEILDSKTDSISMKTLPQIFGINKTKLFGILLLIPVIILEFLKLNSSIIIIPICLVIMLFILFTTLKRNKYYTSFWVESIPVIWWILLSYP